MLSAEYLQDLGRKTADTLKGYLNDNNGWTVIKSTNDILIERKPSECEGFKQGFLYRGKCEYDCPKETVYRYIEPQPGESLRKKWDTDMKDLQLLKIISPDTRVIRTFTNSAAMGLISPRDFVDILLVVRTDTEIVNAGVSINSEEWPHIPKFVRGWNHPCGFMCLDVPGKPNATQLISFIQPDVRGSLPGSLVNPAISNSMIGFFTNLKKALKKDGLIKS